jgi:hypothetical protein
LRKKGENTMLSFQEKMGEYLFEVHQIMWKINLKTLSKYQIARGRNKRNIEKDG